MEWKNEPAADRIIVALDCSPDEAVVLGEKLAGHARWVKIGMTLYYAVGPSIVNTMHKLGFRVFLDLKLHDIPHQVYGAANSIAKAGADLFTVHASGGADMMQSAEKGARKGFSESPREGEPPAVCAITVLTSMDASQLEAIGIDVPPAEQVERLARLAHEAKLDGIVCSPIEAAQMRELLGPDAIIITPGVRPPRISTREGLGEAWLKVRSTSYRVRPERARARSSAACSKSIPITSCPYRPRRAHPAKVRSTAFTTTS